MFVFKCHFTVILWTLEEVQNLERIILGISLHFGSSLHVFICDLFVAGLNATTDQSACPSSYYSAVPCEADLRAFSHGFSLMWNLMLPWAEESGISVERGIILSHCVAQCSRMLSSYPCGSVTKLWYSRWSPETSSLVQGGRKEVEHGWHRGRPPSS